MEHCDDTAGVVPEEVSVPDYAERVFGEHVAVAQHFAHLLATTGVSHGLIGPREVPRLWDRHVGNCGVVEQLLPQSGVVVDVGSGAGLPGIALAIARPHLNFILVEPLLRRTRWLEASIQELGLTNVEIRRGKAQAFHGDLYADVVTSRAVAHLNDLVQWCAPLVKPSGRLLALKGDRAQQELVDAAETLRDFAACEIETLTAHVSGLEPSTQVISMRFEGGSKNRGRRRGNGQQGRRKKSADLSASRSTTQSSRLPSGAGPDSEGAKKRG